MKKAHVIFIFVILSFVELAMYSQNTDNDKFEFSISGGLSIPIGAYQSHDPKDAAILDKNASFIRIIGISKEKNGFASIGYNYNLSFKYNVSTSLRILFKITRFDNRVITKDITKYITSIYNRSQRMDESDYRILSLTPGIGYERSFQKIIFGFNLYAGYSFAEYPYYKFILDFMMDDPPSIFAHEGSKPTLHSFTFGSSVSSAFKISKRMKVGIDADFLSSKFSYHMMNTLIPGGSVPYNISDKLNVKVINVALRFSYSLF